MAHKNAGKLASKEILEDIPSLLEAYYSHKPDVSVSAQKVTFGTSGHRGCSVKKSFNEEHILAITQAICDYRKHVGITGKLFIGKDTHALSEPAQKTAIEVCVANEVSCYIANNDGFTPTPVISFTIIQANKISDTLCDGIVITPSHNPPSDGGFKYNAVHGGPAGGDITDIIEKRANEIIANGLKEVKRFDFDTAMQSEFLHHIDFISPYVEALDEVIDMQAIKDASLKLGCDPLGGSGIEVYKKINEIYGLGIDIVNDKVDPQFAFMSCDHDGKIRMDCSSTFAMNSLVGLKDKYDLAFANDPDFDRHGIVTPTAGLMNPNHYLSVAIWYLLRSRKDWSSTLKIGKTLVSSSMIDRVVGSLNSEVYEVPVGFKWFVEGLNSTELAFGGEESAGATFLRLDGSVWSTDKDGIILNLLAAEMTAKLGKNPSQIYAEFEKQFGQSFYARIDAPANSEEKAILKALSAKSVSVNELAGEKIMDKITHAQGNGSAIGGLKVVTENGWFAARPSGTEDIYKIYAESFISQEHLKQIQNEAVDIVKKLISV